ncbi:TonB-dependent receptor [Thalassotalea eurytherma]|uniref:TonB-dependent receptor n=1 Tax=Thalassotalea eurytherma TaxID=1144278 RepID=A0ABQ6H1P2_9GAMM|nr:TonB-dependent receptor [Thalassotalea eurytherma]GLX81454.1 TonB-dependent receptor [Thalassotalea eurytherma]
MKAQTFNKSLVANAVTSALLLSLTSLVAQAEQNQQESEVERIQVTATHRTSTIDELPFNISAMSGEELESRNVLDNSELVRNFAGITLIDKGPRNGGTANSMIIRGINVEGGFSGADVGQSTVPTVSTYVDSTPVFANFLLKDIERVELLRGPQGTLYGSGALGGTVRYIMNKPDADLTEGSVKLDFGQTDGSDGNNMSFDGMFNLPLSDKTAVRVVVSQVDNDGIIDQVNLYQVDNGGVPVVKADNGDCVPVNGQLTAEELTFNGSCYRSKKDVDTVEQTYVKIALGSELTDNVDLLLTYHNQSDEIGGRRAVTRGADYLGNEYGDYENGSTFLEQSERDVDLVSLEIVADLGFATLTSNTSSYTHEGSGWRDNTSLWVTDRTGGVGFTNWFDILYTGNPRPAAHVEAGFEDEAVIQEFRLVSNTDDNDSIDWLIGAFYTDQDRKTTNFSHLRGLGEYGFACVDVGDACAANGSWWAGVPAINDMDFSYIRNENFTDLAIFGEFTYHFSDSFRSTAGIRWFDNELTNETSTFFAYLQPEDIPFVPFETQSESDTLFKFNLSYDLADNMTAYATYSEGFRRGGSNAVPTSGPFTELNPETVETYGKDTVTNYELGIKGWTENVIYSADIYMVDWENPQLNTGTAWWGFFIAQNGGAAESKGAEFEASITLTDSLNMNVGYAYTRSELTEALIQPQSESEIAPAGARLPGVAEHTFSIALSHTMSLTNEIDMSTNLSAYYQSDTVNSVVPDSAVYDEFDGFTIVNANVQFYLENWVLALYAKNLTNEEGVTASYPATYWSTDTGVFENYYGNNQKDMIARPRTLGISVSYQF